MESALDKMFEDIHRSISKQFSDLLYYTGVSQVKGFFFILIRKKRGKVFSSRRNKMFKIIKQNVQNIAESIYQNYSRNFPEITYGYFPYFKFIRNYGNYHFHFLIIIKEHK